MAVRRYLPIVHAGKPAPRDDRGAGEVKFRCVLIGSTHPRLGEAVCACLVLRENIVWSGPEDILAHLETFGLARPKFPVEWLILEEFPRTASGKVQKNILYDMVIAQREAADSALAAPAGKRGLCP